MAFLDKLKVKVEETQPQKENTSNEKSKKSAGFLQLDVDIYQTIKSIVIIAPIPGVEVKDLDISIENENDVVTIQGKREAPQLVEDEEKQNNEEEENKKFLRQECQWGRFYRQIILPQEVNVSEVEAKFRKGVLILKLPLLRLQTRGKKKISVE